MSLFCLVHGSTQDASGWARLVPELQRRGHRAVCVDVPADEPEASVAQYAQVITQAMRDSTEAPIVNQFPEINSSTCVTLRAERRRGVSDNYVSQMPASQQTGSDEPERRPTRNALPVLWHASEI